jgi:hypothetical protein
MKSILALVLAASSQPIATGFISPVPKGATIALKHLTSHNNHSTPSTSVDINDDSSTNLNDRRQFLFAAFGAAALITVPSSAMAAKGAAEYDFEFYVRDLV